MNGTHQVLAYADGANLIGYDIKTLERNADVLLNACMDIGLGVNTGMEMGGNRSVIANEHIKICGNSYEKYEYLGSL